MIEVAITNCIFDGTERGIRIKTTRGRDILLQANEFGQAPSAIKIDEGVPASAVIQR